MHAHTHTHKDIKVLARVIMKAEKFRDLLRAGWRPRKAGDVGQKSESLSAESRS